MASAQPPADRFQELDSFRGVGACLITLYHVRLGDMLWRAPLYENLGIFIDFFFLLSGFVICHAYRAAIHDGVSALSFMLRRFGRLWPLHIAMLILMFAMEIVKHFVGLLGAEAAQDAFHGKFAIETFFTSILMLQGMTLDFDPPWNGPSWSISVEMWLYALFALACIAPRGAGRAIALVLGAGFIALCLAPADFANFIAHIAFVRGLFGFALGVIVYVLFQRTRAAAGPILRRVATPLELAALAMLPVALAAIASPVHTLLSLPCFALFIYIFAFGAGQVSRLLRWRPLVWLGTISFSIYLVHFPLFTALYRVAKVIEWRTGEALFREGVTMYGAEMPYLDVSNPWLIGTLYAAFFALVLPASAFTYRFIEQPGRLLFRRHGDRFAQAGLAFAARIARRAPGWLDRTGPRP